MKSVIRKVGKSSIISVFRKKYSLPVQFRGQIVLVTTLTGDRYLLALQNYCRIVKSIHSETYVEDFQGADFTDEINKTLYTAALVGPWVKGFVSQVIKSKKHFLFSYPTVNGVFFLADKYGVDLTNQAAEYVLDTAKPSYYLLKRYLERISSRF